MKTGGTRPRRALKLKARNGKSEQRPNEGHLMDRAGKEVNNTAPNTVH